MNISKYMYLVSNKIIELFIELIIVVDCFHFWDINCFHSFENVLNCMARN